MRLYCGIDLHSNNNVIAVIDECGAVQFKRRLGNDLKLVKAALGPYRERLSGIDPSAAVSTSSCRARSRQLATDRRVRLRAISDLARTTRESWESLPGCRYAVTESLI
jgi:hypothetical protein